VSSVTACSIRQKNILSDVLPAVKPGGYLAYSTCSYSEEENEQIVKWLQNEYGMEFVPLEIPQQWPVVASGAGYRLYPHLADSEGFFCALLRRTGGENGSSRMKKKIIRPDRKEEPVLQKWISAADDVIIKKNDQFHMMTLAVAQFFSEHEKTFYFKKAGTVMGEIKGRDFIPNQELAWSIKLSADVPAVELEKSEALKYLRKEAFLPGSDKSGLCLITHKNFGLGWAKILSNRTNNYLPNELRIFK
jgi:NOL1/NOP2/fmu family ribosome biogenesis protein